ncbi:MAG: hypothetical protein GEU98_27750 [Pseudonocardiaceae bacterium]|nr:hypothetical protein [Pseudonocardiaceae bacterium]
MDLPNSVSWTPRDDAELTAAWRLWLELSARAWPGSTWDGTPADAVRPLRDLVAVCNEIHSDYLADCPRRPGPRGEPPDPHGERPGSRGELVKLLQSLIFVAIWPLELWSDDERPLDADRAALLHTDLSAFAEYAAGVRSVLARGGGWTDIDATCNPMAPPAD